MTQVVERKVLGMKISTWDTIELVSLALAATIGAREALDTVGDRGIFGRGKSKKVANLSRLGLPRKYWREINTLGTALGSLVLLKAVVDTMEARSGKEYLPGRGMLLRTKSSFGNVF